ncbi:MAG: putative monooxygenase [Frankiales bacterium]|nr:putative monooxygenase [Frankiales bacterium]
MTADTLDVAVVGGGVAGCAAAARLAAAGLSVVVLEREAVYTDKVRGEGLVNWGHEQAVAMGLGDVVLAVPGASRISHLVNYDESVRPEQALRRAHDLRTASPGSLGILGVGHVELREGLAQAATAAGATVLRGVSHVEVLPGPEPAVSWQLDGVRHERRCRLVIAADGKESATRRTLGVALSTTRPRVLLSGMVVDDGGVWDRSQTVVGVEGRTLFYVIPRGNGRIRLYVGRLFDDPDRLTGKDKEERFLAAMKVDCLPGSEQLATAVPVGPCASYPMTDSWTATPYGEGAVLVGDAAGWSNPITGLGLAVALRDARVLTDLMLEGPWETSLLEAYARERSERMARLRFASALTDLVTAFGAPDRIERRRRITGRLAQAPELGAALAAVHAGPWQVPDEAFSPSHLVELALA